MQKMESSDSILFYVSDKTNELKFSSNVRNFSFNIINENVLDELKRQLNEFLEELKKNDSKMLMIADWSNTYVSNYDIFIPFFKEIIKKFQGTYYSKKKKKYISLPAILINAFDMKSLPHDFVQNTIQLHQKVYLLQENFSTFLLPTISPLAEQIQPNLNVLPRQTFEKLVKDNLELITLLFLEAGDKSGYQILKEIAGHFHCILSQGTLYPLLYQLEKENRIIKKNGKGREVIYSLSPQTKNELKSKKETCYQGYQYLTSFFNR